VSFANPPERDLLRVAGNPASFFQPIRSTAIEMNLMFAAKMCSLSPQPAPCRPKAAPATL